MAASQGSVIGPCVFLVVINLVPRTILGDGVTRAVAYADDTSLTYPIRPADLEDDIQDALPRVQSAIGVFENFGLRVNTSKTNIVLFRGNHRKIQVPILRSGDSEVPSHPRPRVLV